MKVFAWALLLAPLSGIAAEPLLPTKDGTRWEYELVQEKPSDSLDLTEPNQQERFAVTYRLGRIERIDNKDLHRLEIYRGDALESIDLIAVEEHGIICPARLDAQGAVVKLIPPQQMLAAPLEKGKRWKFDGTIGETKVSQDYEISGQENVEVPAGKFRAWRIHCEQTLPASATIDRWFVAGTGFVKVATVIKGASGIAAQKTWLNLKGLPKVVSAPQKNASPQSEKFSAGVSSEPKGEFRSEFKSDTPAIYVRWHGQHLHDKAEIRAVFIAENVANVTADYQIDESTTTAPTINSGGTFTLSKPEAGWAPGTYRVEFFVDDELTQTLKFKIGK
jgi:hypothetical protein